jgi:hypothetical protein
VCLARFRGARICSRCGADLGPLMQLSVAAWMLREAARASLAAGDFAQAGQLAKQAQDLQVTEAGGALCLLSAWLQAGDEVRPSR